MIDAVYLSIYGPDMVTFHTSGEKSVQRKKAFVALLWV